MRDYRVLNILKSSIESCVKINHLVVLSVIVKEPLTKSFKSHFDKSCFQFTMSIKIKETILKRLLKEYKHVESLDEIPNFRKYDVSEIRDLNRMFYYMENLKDISALAYWDVSTRINFDGVFEGCKSLQDISALSSWNVSRCVNFSNMFSSCHSLQDISQLSHWDISKGLFMDSIFSYCESLKEHLSIIFLGCF